MGKYTPNATRDLHVLSLGAGVQSTAVALLVEDGTITIPTRGGKFDAAIFADTQEEQAETYRHLEWLSKEVSYPLEVRSAGKLGEDLRRGRNSTGQRFASIPAFTSAGKGAPQGMTRRQCTSEYKIQVIEKYIRRELLKLQPRQKIPRDVTIHQYMCFSTDEPGRAARARLRFSQVRWGDIHFPLFAEDVLMTRLDCINYLESRVPHSVPRSACVFCPYKSNAEWRNLRDNSPESWERACQVDDSLRTTGAVANRRLDQSLYVHRSCRPLREAYLGDDQLPLFDMECEGGCGL